MMQSPMTLGHSLDIGHRAIGHSLHLHGVTPLHIEFVGHLEKGHGVLFHFQICRVGLGNAMHGFGFGVAVVILHRFVDAQNYEMVLPEEADVPIVVEQNPSFFGRRIQQVATEEEAFVGAAQESQYGGGDIERTAQVSDAAGGFHDGWPGNQKRNFIGMDRDALAAIDARAMIRDYHEDGVGVKWFLPRCLKELAQRVIGIFDGVVAQTFCGVFRNSVRSFKAAWSFVRRVIIERCISRDKSSALALPNFFGSE